ncbi:hypothetical protein FDB61_15830 [Clostridium botulinum]|nr:hypothetical protein [Clostridium botulinum]NFL43157.1 hypothetical protein [Clostridium botulinum]HBJ1645848.1 hypothetical protein [Clostridium botulinum]
MKIAIAEFRARNIKENPMTKVFVEYINGRYYYIASNGQRSECYRNLDIAKEEIKSSWGKWHDFKLLV